MTPMRATTTLLCLAFLTGCGKQAPAEVKPSISYKTKAENASARIDKSYRLSETETVKVIVVPGHPLGERCVVYSNGPSTAMQCRELSATRQ